MKVFCKTFSWEILQQQFAMSDIHFTETFNVSKMDSLKNNFDFRYCVHEKSQFSSWLKNIFFIIRFITFMKFYYPSLKILNNRNWFRVYFVHYKKKLSDFSLGNYHFFPENKENERKMNEIGTEKYEGNCNVNFLQLIPRHYPLNYHQHQCRNWIENSLLSL